MAYGTALIGVNVFTLLPPIIAGILIILRARGRARVLGLVGCGILLLTGIIRAAFTLGLPALVGRAGLSAAELGVLELIFTVVTTVIYAVGLILIALTVGRGRGRQSAELETTADVETGEPTDIATGRPSESAPTVEGAG